MLAKPCIQCDRILQTGRTYAAPTLSIQHTDKRGLENRKLCTSRKHEGFAFFVRDLFMFERREREQQIFLDIRRHTWDDSIHIVCLMFLFFCVPDYMTHRRSLDKRPSLVPLTQSVGHGTWDTIGWYHPFVIGWSKYKLRLSKSRDRWEYPAFSRGHWQSPWTTLTTGKYPLLGLGKAIVKESML